MTLAGPSAEWLADHLAGWGREVDVVSPEDVRAVLARIGRELVSQYGPRSARQP